MAVSQVSGVKVVLYWILYVKIGALLSPIGVQSTVASLAPQLIHFRAGGLGTSWTIKVARASAESNSD